MTTIPSNFNDIDTFPGHSFLDEWFQYWRGNQNIEPQPETLIIFWSTKWCKNCPKYKPIFFQHLSNFFQSNPNQTSFKIY